MEFKKANSYEIKIFIAGDYNQAKQICREFCMEEGACVTVTPTSYVYTGGEETGVIVGFINYPRFPATGYDALQKAKRLAEKLMTGLCQHSYTIWAPEDTHWFSRRPQS